MKTPKKILFIVLVVLTAGYFYPLEAGRIPLGPTCCVEGKILGVSFRKGFDCQSREGNLSISSRLTMLLLTLEKHLKVIANQEFELSTALRPQFTFTVPITH